jgi:hypothetical protein
VSEVFEPDFFSKEIAQMVNDWWETLTPEEHEKIDHERRIEEKWELLREHLLQLHREYKYIPDYRWALDDVLDAMDKLERGEPVE